jgi:hypothetical protein
VLFTYKALIRDTQELHFVAFSFAKYCGGDRKNRRHLKTQERLLSHVATLPGFALFMFFFSICFHLAKSIP